VNGAGSETNDEIVVTRAMLLWTSGRGRVQVRQIGCGDKREEVARHCAGHDVELPH
jgi:hypothetical protein